MGPPFFFWVIPTYSNIYTVIHALAFCSDNRAEDSCDADDSLGGVLEDGRSRDSTPYLPTEEILKILPRKQQTCSGSWMENSFLAHPRYLTILEFGTSVSTLTLLYCIFR